MCAVAVGVTRRPEFGGLVHFSVCGLVPLAEVTGADDFSVAGGGGEVSGGHALSFPFGGDRAETPVVEALSFRPDTSVDNADDEAGAEVGLFEEGTGAIGGLESEELR